MLGNINSEGKLRYAYRAEAGEVLCRSTKPIGNFSYVLRTGTKPVGKFSYALRTGTKPVGKFSHVLRTGTKPKASVSLLFTIKFKHHD